MTNIRLIDYDEFSERLNRLDLISPSGQWRDFLLGQYGASANFLGIFERESLQFIVPTYRSAGGLVSVPKLYSEPLRQTGPSEPFPLGQFLDYLKNQKTLASVQMDFCPILNPSLQPIFAQAELKKRGLCHVLKLNSRCNEEKILSDIVNRKTRNQILSAYRRGNFQMKVSDSTDKFWNFYCRNIKHLGAVPKDKSFFENLSRSFGPDLKVIFAKRDGQIAGANLILIKNRYLYLPFNVSDPEFFGDYVNNFLYWETIKLGLSVGVNIFDFGPSTLRDRSHHHFKEGFGAQAIPIYRIVIYHSFRRKISDLIKTKTRSLGLRIRKII